MTSNYTNTGENATEPTMNRIFTWNCESRQSPTAPELLTMINAAGIRMQIKMYLPLALLVIMVVMFIEEWIYVSRNSVHWRRTVYTAWVLGVYPFLGLFCMLGLFVPRTIAVVEFSLTFYFAIALKKFYNLILHYYGGKQGVVDAMKADSVVSSNPFPCCFVCCCYNQPMTLRRLNILQGLVYQAVIYFPIAFFMQAMIASEGLLATSRAANLGISIINGSVSLSSFILLYAYIILNKSSRYALQQYNIRVKFITIQLIVIFNTVQGFIINTLGRFNGLPCGIPYPNRRKAFVLHYYLLFYELFVLSLVARFVFRKREDTCEVMIKELPTPPRYTSSSSSLDEFNMKPIQAKANDKDLKENGEKIDLEAAYYSYENEGVEIV